jgi:transposase InsO family protein
MHAEKSNFSITRMVRLLEVSRSDYYAWCHRSPSTRSLRQERIEAKVAWFHGQSDEVAGSPKILMDLRDDGETISKKTVAKTMRKLGLKGVCPKRWKTTTITNTSDTYPSDLVQRRFDTGALNQVWVSDISYLRTWEGWLYLATVIDAHSRRVIGWAIDEHMRSDLVEDALRMAITLRGELPETVIFHTDRGTQYASDQITAFAHANGLIRSMGTIGDCLGQRDGRVVLRHPQDRVLLPARVAHEETSSHRSRQVDRRPLQPSASTLVTRADLTGQL